MKSQKNIFKNLLLFFLTLISILNFSSCSYQYYYPQRLNVYAFDSAHQTKIITRPYMQIVGAQIGVARSFSKHFLVALNGQVNNSVFQLSKGASSMSANTFSYAPNLSAGFYSTNLSRNGFEITPQISYERNNLNIKYFPNNNFQEPATAFKKINYLIPSLQFSWYHMPQNRNNIFFTFRFSYLYADAFRDGLFNDTLLSKMGANHCA